jgi:hypothetical protein
MRPAGRTSNNNGFAKREAIIVLSVVMLTSCEHSVRMCFGIIESSPGRTQVANPAKQSASSDPETGSDYQPKDAPPDCAVVNLTDSGNE